MTATKSISLIVHRGLDVKIWLQRPPTVEEARPRQCPRCAAAERPVGGPLGLHGHGVRDRQVHGPLGVTAAATTAVIACRRYRCVGCGAVITVVPRGIEPRRHYGRAAICLALALWALGGQPTTVVRARVGTWPSREATSWRAIRRATARCRAVDEPMLAAALLQHIRRRVRKDGTVDVAGHAWQLDQGFLAGRVVTIEHDLVGAGDPVALHDGHSYPLRPVDPATASRTRRRRVGELPPPSVPFDPPGALLDRAAGRPPRHRPEDT
jgi:hypothetical protein